MGGTHRPLVSGVSDPESTGGGFHCDVTGVCSNRHPSPSPLAGKGGSAYTVCPARVAISMVSKPVFEGPQLQAIRGDTSEIIVEVRQNKN